MRITNSLFYRAVKFITKSYTPAQKEEFIAGVFHFATTAENAETKNHIRQLFYKNRLTAYPVLSPAERLRCYGWLALLEKVKNIDGEIVEAGVGYGQTLINLVIANTYFNAGKKIYAFDSFEGFPEPHQHDIGMRVNSLKKIKGWEDTTTELINEAIQFFSDDKLFVIDNQSIIYRKGFFNATMPQELPEKICLLHIDNDLYEGVLHVLESTFPVLQKGALVIFDEYHDEKWPGVKKAADEFAKTQNIHIEYFHEVLRYGFYRQ